jgi:hypothetical protein
VHAKGIGHTMRRGSQRASALGPNRTDPEKHRRVEPSREHIEPKGMGRSWRRSGPSAELAMREANAYTDGASTGSRGPGGYGAVLTWKGNTEEISGGERDTTNLSMELTAVCAALETIGEGHRVLSTPMRLPGQLH